MTDPIELSTPVVEPKFRVARTITIGDITVCLSVVGGIFTAYSSLDKRVEKVEYSQQVSDSRTKESILDLKVDLKEMQGTLNSVQRDVARIPSQPPQQQFFQQMPPQRRMP